MVELALPDIEKAYKEHEKNPEKHPLYPEEWKKFWNKRYKELQNEKKDPTKHDFKPEWIVFWTKRMKELQENDIIKKKLEIRKKLNLPDNGKERTDELKEQFTMKIKPIEQLKSQERVKTTERVRSSERHKSSERMKVTELERSISKKSEEREAYFRRERPRKRSISPEESYSRRRKQRSRSPDSYSRESPPSISHHRVYIPPPSHHYRYDHPQRYDEWGRPMFYGAPPVKSQTFFYKDGPIYSSNTQSSPKYEEEDTAPLTVVSVLRLLTALEELLGSLGPKVNDLLAKALALEKVKANSADDMLINEDNCVIFETIKEKLKGQLIAGVLDKNKINAVKKAIKNVAAIIHLVNEKVKNKPKEEISKIELASTKPVIDSTTATNSDESIDKAAIAQKLASALVLQGKTDVTSEQLEQLINVYFAMQKKAKESKTKIITTATYLEEISPKDSQETPSTSISASSVSTIAPSSGPMALHEQPKEIANKRKSTSYHCEESEMNIFDDNLPADASSALESLTDSDLQTLLQNFKDLSAEEQQHLIAYLKKLEASEPARVEKLRKFVKADGGKETNNSEKIFHDDEDDEEREIGFNDKPVEKIITPTKDKNTAIFPNTNTTTTLVQEEKSYDKSTSSSKMLNASKTLITRLYSDDEDTPFSKSFIDSDDDDEYSYDELFRAASKNVKEKQMQDAAAAALINHEKIRDDDVSNISRPSSTGSTSTQNLNLSIADTQNLIANIMGSLQKNAQNQNKPIFGTNIISPVPNESHTLQEAMLQPPPLVLPQKQIGSINVAPTASSSTTISASSSCSSVPFYQQQSTYYQDTTAYDGKNSNSYTGYMNNAQMSANYYQNFSQLQGYNNSSSIYDNNIQQTYVGMYGNSVYPPPTAAANQIQMQTNYQNYPQQSGIANTQMQQISLMQQQQTLIKASQPQNQLQQNAAMSVNQQNCSNNLPQKQRFQENLSQQSQQRPLIPHQVQQKQQSRQGQQQKQQQQTQQQQQQQQSRYPSSNNSMQQYSNYY